MTMRTQPRVGYRFDQRRHNLPWVARCFAQRKMLDRHIRLQRAQDEFEDEPHRAVSKLHVESNYRQTIPIKCEFCKLFGVDIGDEIPDIDQPQFGGNRFEGRAESVRRKFDLIVALT